MSASQRDIECGWIIGDPQVFPAMLREETSRGRTSAVHETARDAPDFGLGRQSAARLQKVNRYVVGYAMDRRAAYAKMPR